MNARSGVGRDRCSRSPSRDSERGGTRAGRERTTRSIVPGQASDTLELLAAEYYGDRNDAVFIVVENKLSHAAQDSSRASGCASRSRAGSTTTTGDTFESLAGTYLGDPQRGDVPRRLQRHVARRQRIAGRHADSTIPFTSSHTATAHGVARRHLDELTSATRSRPRCCAATTSSTRPASTRASRSSCRRSTCASSPRSCRRSTPTRKRAATSGATARRARRTRCRPRARPGGSVTTRP